MSDAPDALSHLEFQTIVRAEESLHDRRGGVFDQINLVKIVLRGTVLSGKNSLMGHHDRWSHPSVAAPVLSS